MVIKTIFKSLRNCIKYSDKILWALVLMSAVYSLLLVGSVSRGGINFLPTQALSVLIGILAAGFMQMLDYRYILKYSKWIGIVCIGLIVYTFFAGVAVEGSMGVNARAWIKLPGGITFQPSELVKIGFILTFSSHISYLKKNMKLDDFKSIMFLVGHALIPVVLTHFQGDDGAAIMFLCIAFTMAFTSGIKLRYFVLAIVLGVLFIPIAWNFVLADYHKQRILCQMNPEADPLNMGYQQIQGKLSIGSGGIFGQGLFRGWRVENGVVPIQESDFIFSVAGEELGFIGCILIVLILFFIILRIGIIALKSNTTEGFLICSGFLGLIMFQTIFNLGMCLSILPVMGVTLPFFSAGGSSAACLYFAIGIIQNVYLNRSQIKKKLKTDTVEEEII